MLEFLAAGQGGAVGGQIPGIASSSSSSTGPQEVGGFYAAPINVSPPMQTNQVLIAGAVALAAVFLWKKL